MNSDWTELNRLCEFYSYLNMNGMNQDECSFMKIRYWGYREFSGCNLKPTPDFVKHQFKSKKINKTLTTKLHQLQWQIKKQPSRSRFLNSIEMYTFIIFFLRSTTTRFHSTVEHIRCEKQDHQRNVIKAKLNVKLQLLIIRWIDEVNYSHRFDNNNWTNEEQSSSSEDHVVSLLLLRVELLEASWRLQHFIVGGHLHVSRIFACLRGLSMGEPERYIIEHEKYKIHKQWNC